MRPCLRTLLLAGVTCLSGGCGTVLNLRAEPTPTPRAGMMGCMTSCEPMNGVKTSLAGGVMLMGGAQFPIIVAVMAVELPLSFVGDVLTLPVVYARKRGEPWATWWGTQAAPERKTPQESGSVDPTMVQPVENSVPVRVDEKH